MAPAAKIVVYRAARRQVLRQRRPLASGAENIHQPVDDLAHHDRPLVAAPLRGRDQWRNDLPFRVRQIIGIAQPLAIIPTAVLVRPHPSTLANPCLRQGFTSDSKEFKMISDGHLGAIVAWL